MNRILLFLIAGSSAFSQLPDLVVSSLDSSAVATNSQTLQVSGVLSAKVTNQGATVAAGTFKVLAFEDKNRNGRFDVGTDVVLGSTLWTTGIPVGGTVSIPLPLAGPVTFKGNLVHVLADSDSVLPELNEANNIRHTGQSSAYIPPIGQFSPRLKWSWVSSRVLPEYRMVMVTPMVANLNDDNGDGVVNDLDFPDVVFQCAKENPFLGFNGDGIIRAVDGRNGAELFTVSDPALRVVPYAALAIADLEGDGKPEIIAPAWRDLIILRNDGTLKYRSATMYFEAKVGSVAVADLNGDGSSEILWGPDVFDSQGRLLYRAVNGATGVTCAYGNNGWGPMSFAADLDLDGVPEVIDGGIVNTASGRIKFCALGSTGGWSAVANLDSDPMAEIVVAGSGNLFALKHDGTRLWTVRPPGGGNLGAPTIADFDGDGEPEIGVAGASHYAVFERDGTLKWSAQISDYSSNMTGSSVFDFEGDGKVEVVYNDEQKLRVYDGATGTVLFETNNPNATGTEYPVIADVDGDGHAEIVVSRNVFGDPAIGTSGVFVYGDSSWVPTRKIWNQHAYSVTNINDDATVPKKPLNNWLTPGLNNFRLNSFPDPKAATYATDLVPSFLRKTENLGTVITVRVGNGGAAPSGAKPNVALYRGDPNSGGILIGNVQLSKALSPGEWEDVSVTWQNAPVGQFAIVAVVDPDNAIVEGDETNNKSGATLLFGLGPNPLVDALLARFKDKSVDLSWASVTGAASYRVYRRVGSGPVQIVASGLTSLTFSDTGLSNGNVYYYSVRWVSAQGEESGEGTEASATPTPLGATGANPPTISSRPTTRAVAGTPYSYQLRATDPDAGDVLTYALLNPPSGMTVSASGLIQWLPQATQAGYSRIFVQASDRTGRIATQSFQLFTEVQVVNSPPLISSTPIRSATSGTAYAYQAVGQDPDGGFLVWTLDSAPTGMSVNQNTGLINWTPTREQVGNQNIVVRATDFGALTATQSFVVTVARGNKAPVFTTSGVTVARIGEPYSYRPVASDPDGDPLTFAVQSAPSGMTLNTQTGALSWTPTDSQLGNHPVSLRATDDGGLATVQSFNVNVQPANRLPVITSTAPQTAEVSRLYSYQVLASDSDALDVLTFSLSSAPAGMVISSSGLIHWTPAANQAGTTQSATVRVADLAGASATQTFSVAVRALDTTRPFTDILTPSSGAEFGNDFTITGTVTDDNLTGWILEFRPIGAPTWTTLKTGTTTVTGGTLASFPATRLANDIYRIRLRGQDAGGETSDEIEVLENTNQLKMGDFSLSFEDIRVPGLTFPISIVRKYDSKRLTPGDFGPGWTLSFSETDLRVNGNYDVFITLPDGRRVRFTHTPVGIGLGVFEAAFTAQAGVYDKLENLDCPQVFGTAGNFLCNGFERWDPQNFRLTTKEGVKYTINKSAGIQRIEDRAGNYLSISASGITSNFSRNVSIIRDGEGKISQIVEPGGGSVRYEYERGRLSRFLDQSGKATTYFYENLSFPNYLTKLIDPLNRPVIRTVYNTEGRLVAQCDANGDIVTLAGCVRFDPQAATRLFTAVNARGFKTELLLDVQGNVTRERRFTDATNSLETIRTYDSSNNLLTERDPQGNTKSFTYDRRGNMLTETDPGRRTRTFTYGPCDKVETDQDPAGNVTTYTYDAACNLRFVRDALSNTTEYRYSPSGQRTHFIDPIGNTWVWAYDSRGLLTSLTDPFGKQTTFTFNAMGDLLSRTDRNGRKIDFTYDPSHRLKTELWGNGRLTSYGYNDAGNLTTAIDPDSAITMTFDNLGRLFTSDNIGTPGAPRVVITYGYDSNGDVTEVRDSLGGITGYAYDPLDRLSRVTQSGIGVQEKRVDMEYDTASLLKTIRRFGNLAGTEPVANTRYEYDCGGCPGRLTAIRHRKASDDSVIHDLTFTRDAVGNIIQMTDAEGTHVYTYDAIRRLLAATHSNPTIQSNEFYTYDPAGNRLTSHLSHFYSYSYQVSRNGTRLLQDNKYDYLYDSEGNLTRKTNRASGAYVEYLYDFRNRMTSVLSRAANDEINGGVDYRFDAFDRRIQSSALGQEHWYMYDSLHPVLRVTSANTGSSRRMYAGALDMAFADELAGETRWFIVDQLGTTRNLLGDRAQLINSYRYDSFGVLLGKSSNNVVNELLYAGREYGEIEAALHLRFRQYSPVEGRFIQEDPIQPMGYGYAGGNPVSNTDPLGMVTLQEWTTWVARESLAFAVTTVALNLVPEGIARTAVSGGLALFGVMTIESAGSAGLGAAGFLDWFLEYTETYGRPGATEALKQHIRANYARYVQYLRNSLHLR